MHLPRETCQVNQLLCAPLKTLYIPRVIAYGRFSYRHSGLRRSDEVILSYALALFTYPYKGVRGRDFGYNSVWLDSRLMDCLAMRRTAQPDANR